METMKVRVRVTQKDIDAKCEFPCSRHCPFARAISRVLKPGYRVSVGWGKCHIQDMKTFYSETFTHPKSVVDWISLYDGVDGLKRVKPIRVTMKFTKEILKRVKG